MSPIRIERDGTTEGVAENRHFIKTTSSDGVAFTNEGKRDGGRVYVFQRGRPKTIRVNGVETKIMGSADFYLRDKDVIESGDLKLIGEK